MESLKSKLRELINFLKYLYIVFIFILLFITIIELKRFYQIDLFPYVDTPIDNMYYEVKDDLYKA